MKKLIFVIFIFFSFKIFSQDIEIIDETLGNGLEIVNHSIILVNLKMVLNLIIHIKEKSPLHFK